MLWHPWDESNDTPFDASAATGESCKQTGNGEHKLACQVHGRVVDQQDFDVLGPMGERIEVKQLGPFRSTIEPGVASRFRGKVCHVATALRDAFGSEPIEGLERVGLRHLLYRVEEIATATEKGIGIGSVLGRTFKDPKKDPIIGLKQVLDELRSKESRCPDIDVLLDGKAVTLVSLPLRKFLRVARAASVDPGVERTSVDEILSRIDDEFVCPGFFDVLWKSIKPSEILFEKADSVVFVHEDFGYYVAGQKEIDLLVRFVGTYKGDMQFRVDPALKRSDGALECSGEQGRDDDSSQRFRHPDQAAQAGPAGPRHGADVEARGDRISLGPYIGPERDLPYILKDKIRGRLL